MAVTAVSELDGRQDLRRLLFECSGDSKQALHTRQVRAPFNRADLRDAQARQVGKVFQRPVTLNPKQLYAMSEPLPQAVLVRSSQTERLNGVLQRLTELAHGERLRQV